MTMGFALSGMVSKPMNKMIPVLALYPASASMSVLAAVYELPADGSAVVETDSRITLGDQERPFDVARRNGLGYPEWRASRRRSRVVPCWHAISRRRGWCGG